MGYIAADIIGVDGDYIWKGERNLTIYEKSFEE
jgi:hypothetical protein